CARPVQLLAHLWILASLGQEFFGPGGVVLRAAPLHGELGRGLELAIGATKSSIMELSLRAGVDPAPSKPQPPRPSDRPPTSLQASPARAQPRGPRSPPPARRDRAREWSAAAASTRATSRPAPSAGAGCARQS